MPIIYLKHSGFISSITVGMFRLLNDLLKSPHPHARMAALTVQHHWYNADPAKGSLVIEEEEEKIKEKSGIVSDTSEQLTIRIGTIAEKMKYDINEFSVKSGKKIKLTFANPDFMPHNLVFTKPNQADAVAQMALSLGAQGFALAFVPESSDVLWSTKLVDHGKEEDELYGSS